MSTIYATRNSRRPAGRSYGYAVKMDGSMAALIQPKDVVPRWVDTASTLFGSVIATSDEVAVAAIERERQRVAERYRTSIAEHLR